MLTFTMDEVGMLALISAKYADELLAEAGTDEKLKALALKCKAEVKATPLQNGNHYLELPRFQVVYEREKKGWW